MSISSDLPLALTRRKLGTGLWPLLISLMLMGIWGALNCLAQLNAVDFVLRRWVESYSYVMRDAAQTARLLPVVFILLVWRRPGGLIAALLLLWSRPAIEIGLALGDAVTMRAYYAINTDAFLWRLFFAYMQSSLFAVCGVTACLIGLPQARLVYRRAGLPRMPDQALSPVSDRVSDRAIADGADLPLWLVLLVIALALPILASMVPDPGRSAGRWVPEGLFGLTPEATQGVLETLFFLPSVVAALLLCLRRHWSSIVLAIVILWLMPLSLRVESWFFEDSAWSDMLARLIKLPTIFGFSFLEAVAWTCYLLQAPVLRVRYPGFPWRKKVVTNVDVF